MAKFKQNNVELRDDQKLIFDSAKNKYMSYDGSELFVNTNVSGVEPTEGYHLGTKEYIDSAITTATGSLTSDHGDLTSLDYASSGHTGFQPVGDYVTDVEMTTISGDIITYVDAADVVLDDKIDTTSGTLQDEIDAIVFGTEYTYSSSDGESSTSSATPQEKVTLSKSSLPSGNYHIAWNYEFAVDDNKNSEFNARVQIDDTTTIHETDETHGANVWMPYSGIYSTTLSGTVDIDIDFWDSGTTGINMRRARLELWRVS